MTIQSLKDVTFDELFTAFHSAFADYEISISKAELHLMLVRRGYNASLSFGAFHRGKLVSFILTGIGKFAGKPTAYDTGMGTAKEYRGQGLVTQIFNYSLPALKKAGVHQYLLEVLQNNDKAVSLYKRLGFEITRSFHYYRHDVAQLELPLKKLPEGYVLKNTTIPSVKIMEPFADFQPSWQNSMDAIRRNPETFHCVICFRSAIPVGYAISELQTGDITWLSVDVAHRRKGIGTLLLKALLEQIPTEKVKVLNTPSDAGSINGFLSACGFPLSGKQYEMMRTLD